VRGARRAGPRPGGRVVRLRRERPCVSAANRVLSPQPSHRPECLFNARAFSSGKDLDVRSMCVIAKTTGDLGRVTCQILSIPPLALPAL